MKVNFGASFVKIFLLCLSANVVPCPPSGSINRPAQGSIKAQEICKIVLPHKLRYLENMLNSEVVAKAAKIRHRIEANPNLQDSEKNWPLLLAKYGQDEKKNMPSYSYNNMYGRRMQNY